MNYVEPGWLAKSLRRAEIEMAARRLLPDIMAAIRDGACEEDIRAALQPSSAADAKPVAISELIRAKYEKVSATSYAGTPAERHKDGRLHGLNDALAIAMVAEEDAQPHPSQQAGTEDIARIIDPKGWETRDGQYRDIKASTMHDKDRPLAFANADYYTRESREKAQAILAALKTGEAG